MRIKARKIQPGKSWRGLNVQFKMSALYRRASNHAPPRELVSGFHGNDERIGQKAFVNGVKSFYEVVEQLAK